MSKPITVWKRFNHESRNFEHNHIEDGHVLYRDSPKPKFESQRKAWTGALWVKQLAYLGDDGIVRCDNRIAVSEDE